VLRSSSAWRAASCADVGCEGVTRIRLLALGDSALSF
jgi:hypothetical protein